MPGPRVVLSSLILVLGPHKWAYRQKETELERWMKKSSDGLGEAL
jgi:hypothetical protein